MSNRNAALGFQMKQFLVNGLRARGFKGDAEVAAAGILGNLAVESGSFDPAVIQGKRRGDGGAATGLAQWHHDRWQPLEQWSRSQGMDPYTWQAQLNMILYEMTEGPEKSSWRALETARTPQQASEIFMAKYERPYRENKNDITTTSHYEDRVGQAAFFAGDVPDGMKFSQIDADMGMQGVQPPVGSSYPMGGYDPMGQSTGAPEMDLSQYTEQERDFIASMGLFKAARENMPELMELPNLLAK